MARILGCSCGQGNEAELLKRGVPKNILANLVDAEGFQGCDVPNHGLIVVTIANMLNQKEKSLADNS